MAKGGNISRLAIHDTLTQRGFSRLQKPGSDFYIGYLEILPERVPVRLMIPDLNFIAIPMIWVDPGWQTPTRQIPHLVGPRGLICYYALGSVILDRYDPAGTVIQCLERAEKVLRDALAGRLDQDFAAEFASYWSQRWMLYDLPEGFVGRAKIRYLHLSEDGKPVPVLCTDKTWTYPDSGRLRRTDEEETALVVGIENTLTVNPEGDWPPGDMAKLEDWLAWIDPRLRADLDRAIISGARTDANLVIRAANGLFAVRLDIPKQLQKEEFLKNRREHLPKNLMRIAAKVKVERIRGDPADLQYIYGRNTGQRSNLSGKSILVIGAGAIGGFLAQQLAQCGAGIGGGRLTLVDTDILRTANLGRHLLGVPHLHRNKAVACAEFLNAMLPGAKVDGLDVDVVSLPDVSGYDLIVDATGEEALSIALNQRAVDARPNGPDHVFVWLMGNGSIAQCILVDRSEEFACYKCLKPNLSGQSRYRSLRPDVALEVGALASCGDPDFVTFPVSRAVAAAALACDLILDWANERRGNRFRSQTLDIAQAFHVKNSSPRQHSQCPACAQHL